MSQASIIINLLPIQTILKLLTLKLTLMMKNQLVKTMVLMKLNCHMRLITYFLKMTKNQNRLAVLE